MSDQPYQSDTQLHTTRIDAALLRDMREQGGTYDDWEDKAGKLWVTLDGDFNITDLADAVIEALGLKVASVGEFKTVVMGGYVTHPRLAERMSADIAVVADVVDDLKVADD